MSKELRMALIDSHVHTVLCRHAEGEVADFLAAASEAGLAGLAFTDHAPAPCGYDARHRMPLDQFSVYEQMVSRSRSGGYAGEVLFGIEADYYEGFESFLPSWLKSQPFDVVLGSVHYIGSWGFDNPDNLEGWRGADVAGVWRRYFDLVGRMVDTGIYDVVAHLDLPKKFGHRPPESSIREMAAPLLDRISRAGMAIELNTSGLRRPAAEIYPSVLILSLARERGIPICFGSDAHRPFEVGFGFSEAVRSAREAGYSDCVVFRQRRKHVCPLPVV